VDGDRGFLNGRSNRSSHSGVLRLDDTASPSEIPVIPVQGWIPFGSGSGCVPCPLVGLTHPLTPQFPDFLSNFPDETNSDIGRPCGPPVPRTRTGRKDERLDD
jgi:hypothetical protein